MPILNKDMQLCISLSARPSNIGTRFHNYLYDELGLNFIYKAFATDDIEGAVQGIRALKIRGAAISMPFKEAVIPLVDELAESAKAIDSVNTIVNSDGFLIAYNTDYQAVVDVLKSHRVDASSTVLIRGSGGMAKAVVAAFRDSGFSSLTIASRNQKAGESLAKKYGFIWVSETEIPNLRDVEVLVNVTPIGMSGGNEGELSFPEPLIASARVLFEVVAMPVETPLIKAGTNHGKEIITGLEIMALQAAIQFELYTGVALTDDQVSRAAAFSRL